MVYRWYEVTIGRECSPYTEADADDEEDVLFGGKYCDAWCDSCIFCSVDNGMEGDVIQVPRTSKRRAYNLPVFISSVQSPPLRRMRLTELTDGMVFGSHIRCDSNWSRISHANIPGFSCLKRRIFFTTVGVATCCCENEQEKWNEKKTKKKKHVMSESEWMWTCVCLPFMYCVCAGTRALCSIRFSTWTWTYVVGLNVSHPLRACFHNFCFLFLASVVQRKNDGGGGGATKHRKNMHEHAWYAYEMSSFVWRNITCGMLSASPRWTRIIMTVQFCHKSDSSTQKFRWPFRSAGNRFKMSTKEISAFCVHHQIGVSALFAVLLRPAESRDKIALCNQFCCGRLNLLLWIMKHFSGSLLLLLLSRGELCVTGTEMNMIFPFWDSPLLLRFSASLD